MEIEIKHIEYGMKQFWINIEQTLVIKTLLMNDFRLTGKWRNISIGNIT